MSTETPEPGAPQPKGTNTTIEPSAGAMALAGTQADRKHHILESQVEAREKAAASTAERTTELNLLNELALSDTQLAQHAILKALDQLAVDRKAMPPRTWATVKCHQDLRPFSENVFKNAWTELIHDMRIAYAAQE